MSALKRNKRNKVRCFWAPELRRSSEAFQEFQGRERQKVQLDESKIDTFSHRLIGARDCSNVLQRKAEDLEFIFL